MATTDLSNLINPCREAQRRWAAEPVRRRLRSVRVFRKLLVSENAKLCDAVEKDIGKPPAETLGCELIPLAEACRFLERYAPRILRPRRVPPQQRPIWLWGQRDIIYHRPRGIVGIIGTWNYPLFLNGVQFLHALVAGNGVLWKPSEVTPASSEVLWNLVMRAGFPAGLLQRMPGTREAGRKLAEEADIDHVVFTGHADTGRLLAATLSRRLISSTLELSGLDAMFVLDDADVGMAAKAAWFGATVNAGQTCLAVRRVFVDRKVYPQFLAAMEPLASTATPMPLALPAAGKFAADLVNEAIAHGGRRVGQGVGSLFSPGPSAEAVTSTEAKKDSRPLFRPVVVADTRPDMALCRDATFAPVMAVLPFDRLDDALTAHEQCAYGLGLSIFTAKPERAARLAARLEVGMVSINDVIASTGHAGTPFGGRRASGWGVTQGALGLVEMTVPQVVSIRSGTFRPHYDPAEATLMTSRETLENLLRWQYGGGVRSRARSVWRLMRGAMRAVMGRWHSG